MSLSNLRSAVRCLAVKGTGRFVIRLSASYCFSVKRRMKSVLRSTSSYGGRRAGMAMALSVDGYRLYRRRLMSRGRREARRAPFYICHVPGS